MSFRKSTSHSNLLTDVFLNQVCTKNGRKNSTYPRIGWGEEEGLCEDNLILRDVSSPGYI